MDNPNLKWMKTGGTFQFRKPPSFLYRNPLSPRDLKRPGHVLVILKASAETTAFYSYWFKNLSAPPELWKPYLDALMQQCLEQRHGMIPNEDFGTKLLYFCRLPFGNRDGNGLFTLTPR